MIRIKCLGKSKEGTTITNTGYTNTQNNANVEGVYIWGQYHDHTKDVDGDMTINGNITSNGNITTSGSITTQSDFNGQNLTLTGNISCDDITCDDISSGGDIHTNELYSTEIYNTGEVTTNEITAVDGTITNLVADFLTVTKQAHFFELIIDKIKSNSGQVVLSAADAIIDKVEAVTDGYKLYWRREDPVTHKKIGNDFEPNDQVRCQTFNVHEGTNFNVDNKYYWRLVTDTGAQTVEIDGEQVECNYIEVSDIDKDGTSIPEAGDEIVQLGNRTDTSRQNAIILSAVTSPDPNVTAPSIVQYKGINSYTLNGKILNQMAANGNTFTGNFMVVNGNSVDNVLNLITGTTPTIQTDTEASFLMVNGSNELNSLADAQNLPTNVKLYNGSTLINYSTWTTNSYITNGLQTVPLKPANTYSTTGLYISEIASDNNGGVDVDWNFVQDYSVYSNYSIEIYIEWTDNGNTYHATKTIPVNVLGVNTVNGSDAEFDRLQIISGDATVGVNDTLSVAFTAQVQHVKGDVITTQTNLNNYQVDVTYNNNAGNYQATKDTANSRFTWTDTVQNFSSQQQIPTNITFSLILRNGQRYTLIESVVIPIKFNAGSIFEVKNDAITAAVSSSNGYTDGQIAAVNLTAQGISSRVTAIEGDYVTSSQLTQTANQITMNIYDELNNQTGINIEQGTITLNANTTTINGNLNLTNADNGITIYDSDGTARIQLQPDNIGSLSNFDGGAEYYIRSSVTATNQSSYSLTTDKKKIGSFTASDVMTMKNISCFLKSYDTHAGTNQEIVTATITATIQLFREGNNTAVQTWNRGFTYNSTTNSYTTSDITYTIPTTGVYLFNAVFNYNVAPTYENVYEEVFAKVEQTVQHQTYIGADGMYCQPAHNAMLWSGSDAIVMRWANEGIRVDNEGLKRIPVHYVVSGEPDYLPFDNYTNVKIVYSAQYALNGNEYWYEINPLYDTGLIASECPSYNDTLSGRTSHIKLPPFSFYSIGVNYTLPVGYTVKIINTSAVGATSTLLSQHKIVVEDTDLSRSWDVKGEIRTFVHLGGYWAASEV